MSEARVLIAGGGTGGHISPGIALYEEFKKNNIAVFFLAGRNDIRFSSMKDIRKEDLFLYRAPSFSKNLLKIPFFIIKFIFAILRAKRIINKNKINAVIGMGGYVSAPALIAAGICKASLYLCEQNSVPGKVTAFFTKRALKIFTTFDVTKDYTDPEFTEKLIPVGNPIREKVLTGIDKESAKKFFNLKHCKKIILAIGGSQGALKINELIFGLKTSFPEDFNDVGIIWSTGDFSYNKFKEAISNSSNLGSIYLSAFIDDVGIAYRASDIAISRSGSGVMVELAAMGVPSILIPFPFAALDHQDKNADVYVKAGASLKVLNDDAVPEKFHPVLMDLLGNPTRLRRMSEKSIEAARPHASREIVKIIINDISSR
jgi:UDP-N-acetylglucosamine--N-acetylmuramyl-(pentapeptide) pyrophosphoryl-undecaprenol N-acetylglucosamine transferase